MWRHGVRGLAIAVRKAVLHRHALRSRWDWGHFAEFVFGGDYDFLGKRPPHALEQLFFLPKCFGEVSMQKSD
ncbi:hypothetical protein JTE90_021579 [Oedothorax gibbosus]|uniref:Uncharacterized protein n=1 Tax=Oedothorax gibbosus TaxID=931172 RepID=A0AAV6VNN9_9ARAC|nr:hypothetical protein JTE90_021579 [Oedothorax gibbosus]